ncbi:MAG: phosphatidylserine synthase [Parvicellaceae bacterium]|jgi:phosphatidylserine synthase
MSIIKHIPNAITSGNLLCGCLSIIFAAEGHLLWSAYMIFIGAAFDFGDGLAARALKVQSELGKQLDSLADMATFGVAPGVLMYHFLFSLIPYFSQDFDYGFLGLTNCWGPTFSEELMSWIAYAAFLIPVFSAIRLAKFNLDDSQTNEFRGLATPACAILFAGIVAFSTYGTFRYSSYQSNDPTSSFWDCGEYITSENRLLDEENPETIKSLESYLKREQYGSWPITNGQYSTNRDSLLNKDSLKTEHFFPHMYMPDSAALIQKSLLLPEYLNYPEPSWWDKNQIEVKFYSLIALILIFSLLLLAPIRMFSFKVKSLKWNENEVRYIFLVVSIVLVSLVPIWFNFFLVFPSVIVAYVLTSIINNVLNRKVKKT